ncbi:unnamed protein product, partial [Didymodactylos carnosus]
MFVAALGAVVHQVQTVVEKAVVQINAVVIVVSIRTLHATQNLSPVPITSIEVLYKTGFITPMTYTGTLLVNGIVTSCYVKHYNTYNEIHAIFYPFRLYYYLMKDIFRLTDEPFSAGMQVNSLVKENEFYGHSLVR